MARRQEQESARQEITELGDGVLRLELPIRMPGLGHVNCYALVDDEGVALVDPGLPTPGSFKALQSRLKTAGFRVRDVHTVLVTHSHPDHFGGARRLVKEAGCKLVAHKSFHLGFARPPKPEVSVGDLHAHEQESIAEQQPAPKLRTPWGGTTPWGGEPAKPPFKMRAMWILRETIGRSMRFPAISDPVDQGDVLRLAGREWFVVHTPGHTEDHFCLHDPADEIFLAGDHVLPTITPHISGMSSHPDPLNDFFESLQKAAEIPHVSKVLPAHGHPFDNLAERCIAIRRHHAERLDKIREIARDIGPASVRAFTERLFKKRSWGGMAESETYAHLEHLRLGGDAESHRSDGGIVIYTV
jgi:glyoxylase-like metal-dependent hydrolase (beta-lactamase superfamily II)